MLELESVGSWLDIDSADSTSQWHPLSLAQIINSLIDLTIGQPTQTNIEIIIFLMLASKQEELEMRFQQVASVDLIFFGEKRYWESQNCR